MLDTHFLTLIGSMPCMRNSKILKGIKFGFWLSFRLLVTPLEPSGFFKNKQGEDGLVVRNKARLVAHGFCQKEGIDYEETFSPVARLEVIRIFLTFAASKGFKVFQMDVKSVFLNAFIEESVCETTPWF